ncbi:rsbT co-antagonist protein RsbR [Allocatelliglobosispora scoriae]|uniref:RsbT co-antagonist protein RsbR n=1 Tax=Allocatelliglobosispora scoriae TaxID=643052 RepID=A0A841C3N4_9ACTN|nr:STAS domain-containing protein [Allocatelliglobosispora scoriae]MBB5873441.1 rsbT co-antagonist protein RsbR [Allocatelliglobosispora scoriae]
MVEENSATRLATVLAEHQGPILEHWNDTVGATLRGRLTKSELKRQISDLYAGLRSTLESGSTSLDGPRGAELLALLNELSGSRARHSFSVSETAISIFAVKDALNAVTGGDDKIVSKADFAEFSSFIDKLGLRTVEAYVTARETIITEQSEQLLELSTPVVKLWDGVVAVPIIGTLDSARSQVVMERLLQTLVDTGSPYAILDITGVPAVDTQVAQHILKTVVAAQLMGAQCIISGIRPQIAQTIVALGIEFGEIVTKANLADALQYALRASGVEVRRTTKSVR